jgi:hypothetical protein
MTTTMIQKHLTGIMIVPLYVIVVCKGPPSAPHKIYIDTHTTHNINQHPSLYATFDARNIFQNRTVQNAAFSQETTRQHTENNAPEHRYACNHTLTLTVTPPHSSCPTLLYLPLPASPLPFLTRLLIQPPTPSSRSESFRIGLPS